MRTSKENILKELNKVKYKNERLISVYYINEALKDFKLLNEDFTGKVNKDNPNEVVWDNLNDDNIKNSTKHINTLDKAKGYFNLLNDKVKTLPNNVKKKAFNAAIIGMGALLLNNISKTNDEVIDKLPNDVKTSIIKIDNPVVKKIKKGEDVKTKKIDKVKKVDDVKNINKVSDSLVKFIKHEEGSARNKGEAVLTAYDLDDGAITIGWGHAEKKGNTKMVPGKTKISLEKAEKLLKKDLDWATERLNVRLDIWEKQGLKIDMTQGMFDAIVSLIFNMGIGNFDDSDFMKLLKKNKLKEAKELITKTHITHSGHKPRRKKEAKMFELPDNHKEKTPNK